MVEHRWLISDLLFFSYSSIHGIHNTEHWKYKVTYMVYKICAKSHYSTATTKGWYKLTSVKALLSRVWSHRRHYPPSWSVWSESSHQLCHHHVKPSATAWRTGSRSEGRRKRPGNAASTWRRRRRHRPVLGPGSARSVAGSRAWVCRWSPHSRWPPRRQRCGLSGRPDPVCTRRPLHPAHSWSYWSVSSGDQQTPWPALKWPGRWCTGQSTGAAEGRGKVRGCELLLWKSENLFLSSTLEFFFIEIWLLL